MIDLIGEKVLITTSNWFYAPDGKLYRAVWGTLRSVNEAGKTLGFIPNRAHANWFLQVGELTVMGCQVMYVLRCHEKPELGHVKDYSADPANGVKEYDRPGSIYETN